MVWQDFKQKVFRFAVLKHVRETDIHWDLLLQLPDRPLLATWQIRLDPVRWEHENGPIPALELPDHRLVYLDFQGDISGGRGHVSHIDGGKIEIARGEKNIITCFLRGQLLHGSTSLKRMMVEGETSSRQWELTFNASPGCLPVEG